MRMRLTPRAHPANKPSSVSQRCQFDCGPTCGLDHPRQSHFEVVHPDSPGLSNAIAPIPIILETTSNTTSTIDTDHARRSQRCSLRMSPVLAFAPCEQLSVCAFASGPVPPEHYFDRPSMVISKMPFIGR